MTTTPPTGPPEADRPKSSSHFLAWASFVILSSGAAWFAWMGWDQQYQLDPATGTQHGPYAAWQVVGCGVTLAAIVALASWGRHSKAALLLPPSFTVAWSVTAASQDSSGLWLVGALMVLVGSSIGTAVVLSLARGAKRLRRRTGPSA